MKHNESQEQQAEMLNRQQNGTSVIGGDSINSYAKMEQLNQQVQNKP